MSRQRLQLGTYGSIKRTQQPDGRWMARARYRDFDGKTRQLARRGDTGAKAEAALRAAMKDRRNLAGGAELTAESTVEALLDKWMDDVRGSDRTASTVAYYERAVERVIKPGLGQVTIRESTTAQIDRFLRSVRSVSGQRDARVVLRQAFALAARYDLVDHNPVNDAYRPPAARSKPRALTVEDVQTLRARIRTWQDEQRLGPKRAHDLFEVVDVMLGTGARIGEVLALRWQDCTNLDADRVAVTIAGTVVTAKGKGCWRQDHPKTDAGNRVVILPAFAVEALRRQRDRGIPSAEGLVFPTRTGSARWPANVRTAWRQVRGEDYGWVKPHSFRKTVATLVERELGVGAATVQLGHSATAVTERHYVERQQHGPDVRGVLDRLA